MFKWGTTQLKVVVGSYVGPFPALSIQEIPILPSGTVMPASSIQTGGRLRSRPKMRIILATTADYQILYNEYMASTVKAVELMDGVSLTAGMISSMSPPEYKPLWVECDIEFMEA